MTRILLASNSARRRELIKLTGWDVITANPNANEERSAAEPARQYVKRLALDKCHAAQKESTAEFILTADTIVVDNETIYGKPMDASDARDILIKLRGHKHEVMTAIVLFRQDQYIFAQDLCCSSVPMRSYNEAEIDAYIRTGDPMDKAGAYAIQNALFHPVEDFSGCYASVMGMPLCHLARIAFKAGLPSSLDMPKKCQMSLNYDCRIYEAVLRGDIIG